MAGPGATVEDHARRPRAERLARLGCTADEIAEALRGRSAADLARRPAPASWAPVEVVCHLRDTEESFLGRCRLALAMDEPPFPRSNPDRWAEERQYLTHDAAAALDAFRRQRAETLALFGGLGPDDWARGGVHLDSRGRRTLDDFLAVMSWHDDNHVHQLERALAGLA